MKILINLILLTFFITANIFPQYSSKDKSLVRTTFERKFDQSILQKYLDSGNDREINAALLSIAQSSDTLFIKELKKLNFKEHYEYICFALSEMHPSFSASKYLYSKLLLNIEKPDIVRDILTALGKTGTNYFYDKVIALYNKNNGQNLSGISLALFNFNLRGIGNKEFIQKILFNELKNYAKYPRRYFDAAFAIYRVGISRKRLYYITQELDRLLIKKDVMKGQNTYLKNAVIYLLSILRKEKYLTYNPELFSYLLHSNNYNIKVETAKLLSYRSYNNSNDLLPYLALLNDQNKNIAVELASSIKNIKMNNSLSNFLTGYIARAIKDSIYPEEVRGEFFLSYLHLFPFTFENARKLFSDSVPAKYFYKACTLYDTSHSAFNFLVSNYNNSGSRNKVEILTSILDFQNSFNSDNRLLKIIEQALSSDSPPLISIASDGLDSLIISNNPTSLKKIITKQTKKYINNPEYFESLTSLSNLAEKIGNDFYKQILFTLSNSTLYSVKKFAYLHLSGSFVSIKKGTGLFNNIWKYSFKYKGAIIRTVKGVFKIQFLPQFAPITVGNFCLLSRKKFFNGNIFHRVVPGFVIQGGDPTETGWGGPGYDIVSEFSPLNFNKGVVGMASAGKDTEGSQWFVTTGCFPHLNGRYTIFAEVVNGQKIVDKTMQDDKIISVTLY